MYSVQATQFAVPTSKSHHKDPATCRLKLAYASPFLLFSQRTVDRLYVDRTFGGQDWFGLRQQAIKVGVGLVLSQIRHISVRLRQQAILPCRRCLPNMKQLTLGRLMLPGAIFR